MGNSQVSNSRFGATSTGEEVAQAFADRAKGKVVLITGGGGGLGYETARVLASVGATVYITCRTQEAADKTAAEIQAKAAVVYPQARVHGLPLELGSLSSVEKCAAAFLATGQPLHILINNAGIMSCPKAKTSDGFELQFGTNYLGHFHLTNLLVNKLKASGPGSRVVTLSSIAHYICAPPEGIMFDDLSGDVYYQPWQRYGQAKFAALLHARALQARYPELTAVSLHPGGVSTGLSKNAVLSALLPYLLSFHNIYHLFKLKSLQQGVATSVLCALDPSVEQHKGEYYQDCAPETHCVHPLYKDDALADKLWRVSEKLISARSPAADLSAVLKS